MLDLLGVLTISSCHCDKSEISHKATKRGHWPPCLNKQTRARMKFQRTVRSMPAYLQYHMQLTSRGTGISNQEALFVISFSSDRHWRVVSISRECGVRSKWPPIAGRVKSSSGVIRCLYRNKRQIVKEVLRILPIYSIATGRECLVQYHS